MEGEILTVSSNDTWSDDVTIQTDILIESGNTLTITGTLSMSGTKRIMIEPGAKLHVNGGIITNNCGAFWLGVEVWGNSSLSQFGSSNQGEFLMTNGGLIEHAEVGVRTWHPGYWDESGGICKVYNSTFLNCKKAVGFAKYSNDYMGTHYQNLSRFINVDFLWDDSFRDDEALELVSMYKVDGIPFTGCSFEDQRTTLTTDKRSHGIHALDAKFSVTSKCSLLGGCPNDLDDPSWDLTTFKHLDNAIPGGKCINITFNYS